VLVERLTGRGTEPADVIERRLQVATVELAAVAEFDATIVNDDVESVCERLVALMGVSS
jgi:guanylate kinase